jgi:hypothetical protein
MHFMVVSSETSLVKTTFMIAVCYSSVLFSFRKQDQFAESSNENGPNKDSSVQWYTNSTLKRDIWIIEKT